jgi:phosphomevalonate kinase
VSTGILETNITRRASLASLSRNPFVEVALSYALTYISTIIGSATIPPSSITILADNDYYSQPPQASSHSAPHFSNFGVRLQDAHKTGLGSSAALVTAFTGAVLSHYLPSSSFDITSPSGQERLHNLAQAAHCAAQGKVGSGFDVAAAVYGTCIYRRFSPSILSNLGDAGSQAFSKKVQEVVENTSTLSTDGVWDTEIRKDQVRIPEGMTLVMCDVDCGSQTVGMVKKVLEWRKSEPEASKSLWDALNAENENLAIKLGEGVAEDISASLNKIRGYIREMGEKSGVPIEPAEQTVLLDSLAAVDGVAGGVVPGAGGYDAVALLIKDDATTINTVKAFLKKWSTTNNTNVKLLDVKGEMEGARKEKTERYTGWVV